MRVFVTDGHYKNTLAIVRSLGGRGAHVVVGAPVRRAQACYSKHCAERVVYPDDHNEEAFVAFIADYAARQEIDLVLPVGYRASTVLSRHARRVREHARLLVADDSAMAVAADKRRTMALASQLGVPTPRMFETPDAVSSFPVVVKGVRESGRVRYVNSKEEMPDVEPSEFIAQEYVPGQGFGFYALCNHGETRAIFMHRRLREFPVTGGASTAAESFRDPRLQDYGTRLLEALKWHGVAMVEFKLDARDGDFKLMEINPKFWGSLDLSIAAGVDFPWLAARMAIDGDIEPVLEYREDVKFHWLLPDEVLHVLARPSAIAAVLGACFDRRMGSNIWLSDLRPNLFQVWLTVRTVAGHVVRGELWRPHGTPRVS